MRFEYPTYMPGYISSRKLCSVSTPSPDFSATVIASATASTRFNPRELPMILSKLARPGSTTTSSLPAAPVGGVDTSKFIRPITPAQNGLTLSTKSFFPASTHTSCPASATGAVPKTGHATKEPPCNSTNFASLREVSGCTVEQSTNSFPAMSQVLMAV
ncbi:hypothetical protein ACKS0A_07457 [Histoplasma ohiense]